MSFDTGLQKNIRSLLKDHWCEIPINASRRLRPPFPAPPLHLLFAQLSENLSKSRDILRSEENWRFTPQYHLSEINKSSEKIIEKSFVQWLGETKAWANQVPTCSGYSDGDDGKRSLDLVQNLGAGRFKFIELKTVSNTPTYAAIEILLYGLTYLLARKHIVPRLTVVPSLLQAKEVKLVVLAPDGEFYAGYLEGALREFERTLDLALRDFALEECGVVMSFAFEILGPGFVETKLSYTSDEVRRMADGIAPLFPR